MWNNLSSRSTKRSDLYRFYFICFVKLCGSSRFFGGLEQVEYLKIVDSQAEFINFLLVGSPSDERIRFKLSNFVFTFCLLNISDDGLLNVTSSFLCCKTVPE